MKAPGTAYDDPVLGKDPQPADMDGYVDLPHDDQHDSGGVHINSGIPNHAFYLAADRPSAATPGSGPARSGTTSSPHPAWPRTSASPGSPGPTVDAATARFGADSPAATRGA